MQKESSVLNCSHFNTDFDFVAVKKKLWFRNKSPHMNQDQVIEHLLN